MEDNRTAAERAKDLESKADFEKRSAEFSVGLDELIKQTQVGITVQMHLPNYSVDGGHIIFSEIKPYIARIDLKKLPQPQEENGKTKKGKRK